MSDRVSTVRGVSIALVLLVTATMSACSLRRLALTELAGTLSGGAAGVFASDDDPELVRAAVPFSLKTMEALLIELPEDEALLLSTCSGFAQYAYAYPATDAERAEQESWGEAEALRVRARKLFLRGRDYCLRALELRLPGVREDLLRDPAGALAAATRDDVPLLYWSAASWGGALSYGLDQPALVADLPAIRVLFERALALDEAWGAGSIHATLISLEALPEIMGGSPKRARTHFERAVALSDGASAGPYVSFAHAVARPAGDRAGFVGLLEEALAVDLERDPSQRLANEIAQRRARFGLEHVDEWFVPEPTTP
ncbi:MAG: TRAP transporter TatT component family protein [Myxococcota bacterium]